MALGEITAFIGSIRAASLVVKGIISLDKDVEVKQEASKLLGIILDLQQKALEIQPVYQSLLEENIRLKKELAEQSNWAKTASCYQLTEVSSGVFVYVLQKAKEGLEPEHWACPRCFENKKKSILQLAKERGDPAKYICLECQNAIYVDSAYSLHGGQNG